MTILSTIASGARELANKIEGYDGYLNENQETSQKISVISAMGIGIVGALGVGASIATGSIAVAAFAPMIVGGALVGVMVYSLNAQGADGDDQAIAADSKEMSRAYLIGMTALGIVGTGVSAVVAPPLAPIFALSAFASASSLEHLDHVEVASDQLPT